MLVIEDEEAYRKLAEFHLRRAGYRVVLAATGQAGLDAMETAIATCLEGPGTIPAGRSRPRSRRVPDLVLLDLRLPDIDGHEVCRRVRELSDVPVLMLTAMSDTRHKVRALGAGADDYITKPFDEEELLARGRSYRRC